MCERFMSWIGGNCGCALSFIWNLDLGTGNLQGAFIDHLLMRRIKMDKRDQELLDKQLAVLRRAME
jgi:hypothetical protein